MFADELIRTKRMAALQAQHSQRGEVIVKFFWWPLIISIALSVILTIILNLIF